MIMSTKAIHSKAELKNRDLMNISINNLNESNVNSSFNRKPINYDEVRNFKSIDA